VSAHGYIYPHLSCDGQAFGLVAEHGGPEPITAIIFYDGRPPLRLTSEQMRAVCGDGYSVALEADVRCAG
jgi:hypothetical protein